MFEKQAEVKRFNLIQTFYACKQEDGKLVATYVLQMKGYVDQLERLGYVLPQDLTIGLILNGLTKDFTRFVRNYNMHNMEKTIGELHAKLIEYEKGLPKKAETPKVMMIKGGKIQKSNKKSLKAKGKGKTNGKGKDKQVCIPKPKNPKLAAKEHPAKDDTCHHCKEEGHSKRNCPAYLAELIKKKKQVGTASSSDIFVIELFYFPSKSWVYDTSCGTLICNTQHGLRGSQHNLDPTYLWRCHLAHISKQRIEKLQHEGILKSLDDESFVQCVSCLLGKMTRKSFPHRLKRATDLLGIKHTDVCGPLRHVSRQESAISTKKIDKTSYELWYEKVPNLSYLKETMGYYFYFPSENKIVVARYAEFFEKNLITQEVSGRAIDLEEIQDEDTSPSEITSKILIEVKGFEPPQKEVIPIRRSEKTHQAPTRLCLNVEVEEHNCLSKWIFKKKTDMDGIVHTYKARPVAKGYTQLYGVNYEETSSPVADIRAIRILISITVFYDYEIWQMDIKTAFLNGYLDEDIYMVQPEGFVNPNYPRKYASFKDPFMVLSKYQEAGIKDLMRKSKREAAFILGIKIYRDMSKRLIGLGQNAYIEKILKRYKMDNYKRGHIPMQEKLDLNKSQGASTPKEVKRMQNVPYASVVGSTMYAVKCTRPDVAFAQK
uniref:Zinc finger, CCHC-type n=1 Tax=Tanacetum cinerariifolium TaxID=118510 RepID=A0A6L2JVP9_TANCI|nr:zinc finger, CCHC-type [Tanacetum cinerariifolium]